MKLDQFFFKFISRYDELFNAFLTSAMFSFNGLKVVIFIIWLASICLAIPQVSMRLASVRVLSISKNISCILQTLFTEYVKRRVQCVSKEVWAQHLNIVSTLISFFVPMIWSAVLLTLILIKIRNLYANRIEQDNNAQFEV